MALTETITKVTVQPQLNSGLDPDGDVKTVTGGLGATLSSQAFIENMTSASEKVLNILGALGNVLQYPIYKVNRTVTATIDNEE